MIPDTQNLKLISTKFGDPISIFYKPANVAGMNKILKVHYGNGIWVVTQQVPSLCWLATTRLAFWRPKSPGITTRVTFSICKIHPISPNTLSIDPYLPLSHTSQIQSQRFFTFRCIKVSLQVFIQHSALLIPHMTFGSLFKILLTLCHDNGRWVWVASDSGSQSTAETPVGEIKFIISPFRPTYLRNPWDWNFSKLWCITEIQQMDGKMTLPDLIGPFLPRQILLSLIKTI